MRCYLYSMGPSLAFAEGADLSIGVGASVTKVECDWWVFMGLETYQKHEPAVLGRPGILSHAGTLELIRGGYGGLDSSKLRQAEQVHAVGACEYMIGAPRTEPAWCAYSGCAALVLAVLLGATEIETFGVDMAGTADAFGNESEQRTQQRWADERALWHSIATWAASRGVTIGR